MDDEKKKKIRELMLTIPKEHRKTVKKLNEIYQEIGAQMVLDIVANLSVIPANHVDCYDVWHDDAIDGG